MDRIPTSSVIAARDRNVAQSSVKADTPSFRWSRHDERTPAKGRRGRLSG